MTMLLTFWTCIFGTPCDIGHSLYHNSIKLPHSSFLLCDETNAITDDPLLDAVMAAGHATRHTCEPTGDPT